MIPTVCHFTTDATTVYFLDDYTDELAAEHYLSTSNEPLSVAFLRSLWEAETNPGNASQR